MSKVSDHVRKVHKVHTTTDTIANFVKKSVRTT
jgi:predicted small metal-binding protein